MKILLLNSGGLDSLACAIVLKHNGHETHSLYVDLGYPNTDASKVASKLIADTYCVAHDSIAVVGLQARGFLKYGHEGFEPIAHQQMVLNTLGASYAQVHEFSHFCSGTRKDTPVGPGYLKGFNSTLAYYQTALIQMNPLELFQPINDLTNDQWFGIIKDSPVLHQTVSCLSSPPCGTCFKCKIRATYGI